MQLASVAAPPQAAGLLLLRSGAMLGRMWRPKIIDRFLNGVSEGFIWGVGITRPRTGKERFAAIYITALLIGTVLFAVVVFFLLKSFVIR